MGTSALKVDADAIDVETTDVALRVVLADGREVSAPLAWFPRLRDGTTAKLAVDRRWARHPLAGCG